MARHFWKTRKKAASIYEMDVDTTKDGFCEKNTGFMKSTIAIIIIDVIDLTMLRRLHYYELAVS